MSDPIEMAIAKIQALEVMAVSEIDRVYNQALHNAIAVVKGMPSAQPDRIILTEEEWRMLKKMWDRVTQPEIIRCKDCKHSEHWYRDKRRCFLWHETGIGVFEDGYCNYAERKGNG